MIEQQSFLSNEILTGLSILSVLSHTKELQVSKCVLIEPMLNHKELRAMLKNSKTIIRSIEELIMKKTVAFSNFHSRFIETLPLSINSILLMSELRLLKINGNKIIFSGNDFDFKEHSLGTLMEERILACNKIADILNNETVENLYLNLRVEL